MGLKDKMYGYEIEHMPNVSFRIMSFFLALRDVFIPVGEKLDQFGIIKGFTVIDFGCGPGSYIEYASKLVGNSGRVFAVDVQPLAIKKIREKIRKKGLENVFPVRSKAYPVDIESQTADIIYALDMFHHIKDTHSFLKELHRLLKAEGKLFLEGGHQSMDQARSKLLESGFWVIKQEQRNLFVCTPS